MGILYERYGMKVGLLIYGNLNILSGGYIYDRILVEGLRRLGNDVKVIAIPYRQYVSHLQDNFSRKLQLSLISQNLDVMIQDELSHPSLFLLNRKLKGKIKYPIVSLLHLLQDPNSHTCLLKKLHIWIEKMYLKTMDGLICNSHHTKITALQRIGAQIPTTIAYPAATHIECPQNLDLIEERAMQPGPLRILYLGNLIRRKGALDLIMALKDLDCSLWKLDIVGRLDMEENYVKLVRDTINKYEIMSHTTIHGTLTGTELSRQINENHILVLPSYYEGFGMVYLECMGHGLPAIGTTAGAVDEIITHDVNGFLIEPGNITALRKYISIFMNDRNKLIRMGKAAVKRFESHPSWDDTIIKIHKFLNEMINHE